MKFYNNFKPLVLIILISQLLTACTYNNKPIEKIGDGGFLSGKPC